MARALTGTLLVIVLGFSIIFHPFVLTLMLCFISVAGLYEFYSMVGSADSKPQSIIASVLSVSILVSLSLFLTGFLPFKYLLLNVVFVLVIFMRELFGRNAKPFSNIAFTLLGLVYITLPLSCLMWFGFFASNSYSWHIILSFFALVWIYDTFAFFTGMLIGKHRLYERISPKKSWEGAIGGAVFAIATAYFISMFSTEMNSVEWMAFALIVVIFATIGDLTESMLKRSYNLKDSGSFLPGHGGILDRFDSVFIAAPAIFIFLQLIKN